MLLLVVDFSRNLELISGSQAAWRIDGVRKFSTLIGPPLQTCQVILHVIKHVTITRAEIQSTRW
jgi:hypothetical protein